MYKVFWTTASHLPYQQGHFFHQLLENGFFHLFKNFSYTLFQTFSYIPIFICTLFEDSPKVLDRSQFWHIWRIKLLAQYWYFLNFWHFQCVFGIMSRGQIWPKDYIFSFVIIFNTLNLWKTFFDVKFWVDSQSSMLKNWKCHFFGTETEPYQNLLWKLLPRFTFYFHGHFFLAIIVIRIWLPFIAF